MSRDLILIALSLITWGVGEGMFIFFQPLYLEQLGANPVRIGGILGAVGLAMMLSYLPAGYLSDRFGRRPLLLIAWSIGLASTWVMALAPSLPFFVTGMILYGMTAFVTVPLNSYTTAARGRLSVGRTITLISATFSIGSILGPLLGGWIGTRYGLQANLLIAGFIFIVSTAIIFFIRPQPVETTPSAHPLQGLEILRQPRYLHFLGIVFLVMFGLYLPQPLSQNFLKFRQVSLTQIGLLLTVRSLGMVVLNLTLGQINARLGLLASQVAMGLCALLLWLGGGYPAYLLGYFLMGSYATARGMIMAQGRILVVSANMGMAYGMIETVNALAVVFGPPLAGLLYQQKPELVYQFSVGLIGIGLLVNLLWPAIRRRDVHAFEEKEKAAWTLS
jgi:MFS family permease